VCTCGYELLSLCACVCACLSMIACMRACQRACRCTQSRACTLIYAYTHVHAHCHTHTHTHTRRCTHTHTCTLIYTYTYIYIYIRTHVHIYIHTYTSSHVTAAAGRSWTHNSLHQQNRRRGSFRQGPGTQQVTCNYICMRKKQLICNMHTGWPRLIGCLKLQIIFCKRATDYKALLRKMTYKDKASMGLRHSVTRIQKLHVTCFFCATWI